MKLGERKYTQDEGPAQEPWTEAPGKSPRAADGKTGAQDAPRRRGVRGTDAGESACETPEAPEKHKFRLFTGDRVLWIIVAALAVISVLVVYS
ncbi:MAG: FtsW/RodA/SpoVE family cell cycle protein, partial [Alistipes sp.]|nr:FtsW/RodA/SpoVE family cell cycle protein [Alistipes sp.]